MEPRAYGPYPYSAIIDREPLRWPDGARIALWVVPNIEAFPLDVRVPGGIDHVPDVSAWGRRDYGNRVGIFTPSGGAGGWMADGCAAAGLEVPELDAETRAAIAPHLPAYGATQNPVDVTAQAIWVPQGPVSRLAPRWRVPKLGEKSTRPATSWS